jgi:Ca2+-binding EF-hand superfamily protein
MDFNNEGKISVEKATAILQKHGLTLNAEQVAIILELLYKLANVAVAQYLNNEDR